MGDRGSYYLGDARHGVGAERRGVRGGLSRHMTQGVAVRESCPFCGRVRNALETDLANAYAIAFDDAYPVNPGHTLIVTKRHVERYGEPGRVMNIPGGPQAEPS